ncbi:MAG: Gfo/Idh/MocA family oxidoreductase [Clostridia bacterium]|nr:Gfo/Idh/MocA family oxidoreductase [Clostridia bacterium]
MSTVKIGVFGAKRGMEMINMLMGYPDAKLVAICDKHQPLLDECAEKAREHGLKIELFADFEDFFECDMDAVVLANYAVEHAPYAIRFMNSGRHVLSECLPVQTMKEAVELAETVEKTGKIYALAENCCFFKNTFEMYRRYRRGDIGEVTYAEGEYVHPFETLKEMAGFTYGDKNHWRYHIYSTYYCTHSLGPLLYITGLRPVRVIGMEVPPTDFMNQAGYNKGVAGATLIQLENGAVIKNLVGSLRKLPLIWNYQLYGTAGCMETDRWKHHMLNVYTDNEVDGIKGRSYYECKPVFENELTAKVKGHGGADFYATHYFIQSILGDEEARKLSVDVYKALDMTIPGILGYRSILGGNIPIDIPDFRIRECREPFRCDIACTDPKVAGASLLPVNSFGDKNIPDSVYKMMEELWKEGEAEKAAQQK